MKKQQKKKKALTTTEKLKKLNKQLRDRDKAKDRFFALTSHEIRTPLSSIIATAQYIHDGFCDNEKEVKEYVDVILEEGRHLLTIINDILDYSKLESGKIDLSLSFLNPMELLRARTEHMNKLAMDKGVTFEIDNRPCESCYFDTTRLTQIFDNVLHNGIKFNRKNGKLVLKAISDETHVTISIADTGSGIPKSQQHRVFNEFETIENIRNHHTGTGLGMPISKRLIEKMGGSISFRSIVGKGTTFLITIPRQKVLAPNFYGDNITAPNKVA